MEYKTKIIRSKKDVKPVEKNSSWVITVNPNVYCIKSLEHEQMLRAKIAKMRRKEKPKVTSYEECLLMRKKMILASKEFEKEEFFTKHILKIHWKNLRDGDTLEKIKSIHIECAPEVGKIKGRLHLQIGISIQHNTKLQLDYEKIQQFFDAFFPNCYTYCENSNKKHRVFNRNYAVDYIEKEDTKFEEFDDEDLPM